MFPLSRRQQRSVTSRLLRNHWQCTSQLTSFSYILCRNSDGKTVKSHNLVPIAFYSSSRHAESDSSNFESQRMLLNRQTAKPVLFDELESDDELDFSLEEKPSGEGTYTGSSLLTGVDDPDVFLYTICSVCIRHPLPVCHSLLSQLLLPLLLLLPSFLQKYMSAKYTTYTRMKKMNSMTQTMKKTLARI